MDLMQTAIQGGGIGVAIYAIYILNKIVSNHLAHNTKALSELSDVIKDLKTFLQNKL